MRVPLRIVVLISLVVASMLQAAEPAKPSSPCTTILIVRHAEQTDPDADDPPLSEAGEEQARALSLALEHSGVQAIYVTQFKRTKDTAAPTASALRVPVTELPVERTKIAENAAELAKKILSEHPGGTVLVVGHSNTVPVIVDTLAHVKIRPIERTEFDRLIVVTAGDKACTHVLQAQYGHAP